MLAGFDIVEIFVVNQLVPGAVGEHLLVVIDTDTELLRDFGLGRRALQHLLQLADRGLDLAHVLTHAARQPVDAAQFVEHRAAYALHRIGLELVALFFVTVQRIEQTHHADLDQVIDLDIVGQARLELVREPLDQRCVVVELERRGGFSPGVIHGGFLAGSGRSRGR